MYRCWHQRQTHRPNPVPCVLHATHIYHDRWLNDITMGRHCSIVLLTCCLFLLDGASSAYKHDVLRLTTINEAPNGTCRRRTSSQLFGRFARVVLAKLPNSWHIFWSISKKYDQSTGRTLCLTRLYPKLSRLLWTYSVVNVLDQEASRAVFLSA